MAQLLEQQDSVCPICQKDLKSMQTKRVHVDHNHLINDGRPNVRGVLCQDCNLGMGRYSDSIENHLHAIEYLRRAASIGR